MGYSNSYATQGISYRNGSARRSYGYAGSLSARLNYSLVMPKTYGTDVNLDSYIMRSKQGIAGYVKNLIKYSLGSLKTGYSYPGQKKQELYKILEMMKNYELKLINAGSGKPGVMIPNFPRYDLPSMRRPVINLEARLN